MIATRTKPRIAPIMISSCVVLRATSSRRDFRSLFAHWRIIRRIIRVFSLRLLVFAVICREKRRGGAASMWGVAQLIIPYVEKRYVQSPSISVQRFQALAAAFSLALSFGKFVK